MADLINAGDSLNIGRNKLNAAISDVAAAKGTIDLAKSTAEQALSRSEVTQTQLGSLFDLGVRNLYNKAIAVAGYAVDSANGNLVANATYKASDYIAVIEGAEYFVTNTYNIAFYNADKIYVSGKLGGWSRPLIVPIGAKYLRVTAPSNDNLFMVVQGSDPSSYIPYGDYNVKINDTSLIKAVKELGSQAIDNHSFKKNVLGLDVLKPFKSTNINLANPSEFALVDTAVDNTSGNIVPSTGYQASGYIEVDANTNYCVSNTYNYAWYDNNKYYISGVAGGFTSNKITSPPNAAYLRTTFNASSVTKMVAKGDTLPSYVAYNPTGISFVNDDWRKKFKTELNVLDPANPKFPENVIPVDTLVPFKINNVNIANPSEFAAIDTAVNNSTGAIYVATGYQASGYIPVTGNTNYSISDRYNYAWYNVDKVYISGVAGGFTSNTITAPSNAAFLRTTFNVSRNKMVVKGDSLPTYTPYNPKNVIFADDEWKQSFVRALGVSTSSSSRLSTLKWNALGDSITFGLNADGYPYHTWISERTGITVRNYGISTSTVTEMVDKPDPSMYNPMCIRYADMSDDADIVTIMAGTNDVGHGAPLGVMTDRGTTTFYGALHTMLTGIINKYPGKSIGYMLPPYGNPDARNEQPYIDAIKEVCRYYAIPVCDTHSGNGLTSRVQSRKDILIPDGLHPSKAGQQKLSFKIEQFLLSI